MTRAILLCAMALAGCSSVDSFYRDVSGARRDCMDSCPHKSCEQDPNCCMDHECIAAKEQRYRDCLDACMR